MNRLSVKGIENLMNIIDGLSSSDYSFHILIDDHQAQKPKEERYYILEIADIEDGEGFEFYDGL